MESSEPSEPASLADAARRSSVPDVPLHQTDLEAGQPASGFPASDATALDNARRGTWVINDYLDGWMLLGANGRPVTARDEMFRECLMVSAGVLSGNLPDPTGGANHYHARGIAPNWAAGEAPTVRLRSHLFYKI